MLRSTYFYSINLLRVEIILIIHAILLLNDPDSTIKGASVTPETGLNKDTPIDGKLKVHVCRRFGLDESRRRIQAVSAIGDGHNCALFLSCNFCVMSGTNMHPG